MNPIIVVACVYLIGLGITIPCANFTAKCIKRQRETWDMYPAPTPSFVSNYTAKASVVWLLFWIAVIISFLDYLLNGPEF
jgi:hypothetical protein